MNKPRKLFVKSFGCQMNVYDSRRMADTLAPQGYVETPVADDADLVILNTCHIREKAAEKVYSELGRVRRLKEAAAADGRRVVMTVTEQGRTTVLVRRSESVQRLATVLANAFTPDELRVLDAALPLLDRLAEEI